MDYYVRNNELYHYGRKGMKWGERIFSAKRYENRDGSLTLRGERRMERDMRGMSRDKRKDYAPDPSRWVREDMERSKRLADASQDMVRRLETASRQGKKNRTQGVDLSKMTDGEMRAKIDRALLERRYSEVCSPQTISRGRAYTGAILSSAGTALAFTGSALSIALAIKDLMGR